MSRSIHTAQAESVVPEGRQSNGDRYSVASVSTDSATGNRGMQRHPASKSGPTTRSTAARLGKTRTARKSASYGKYDTRIRQHGQRLDVLWLLMYINLWQFSHLKCILQAEILQRITSVKQDKPHPDRESASHLLGRA